MTQADFLSNAGQRLFPHIVDDVARSNPERSLGVIPKGADVSDGFQEVTAAKLAYAVNVVSWWIENEIGRATQEQTIAYMGSNDIRYLIFILASMKTGYKLLLPSTRLSDEAYQHILKRTDCLKFFYTSEKEYRVSEIRALHPEMHFAAIPTLPQIMDDSRGAESYPFTKTFAEAQDEVALIIHSSGTTGMPKPVPFTHGYISVFDSGINIEHPKDRRLTMFYDLAPSKHMLYTTPFFHLMGFIAFTASIFHHIPFVICPDKPLSVELLTGTIQSTKPAAALLPPSMVEEMSHSEAATSALHSLDYLYFAGAPLAPEVGNRLSDYIKLVSIMGSSEAGVIISLVPEGEGNWGYFEWNPAYGVDMQDRGEGLYEMVIPRKADSRKIHGIFHSHPHLNEYHTNDLFVQHPSNPKLWKYHGRYDDVIVLSNGEKLTPVTLEKAIEGHPLVHRALLIGQSRFQTSLLVEPNWVELGDISEAEFIDAIWAVIQKANNFVPNYGRVMKNMIRLSKREKPFDLTFKGTTKRHTVNKDYKEEIDAIYAAAEDESVQKLPETPDLSSLLGYVHGIVSTLLDRSDVDYNEDLYQTGLDSLQTIQLAKTLRAAVSSVRSSTERDSITNQQIYAHPTVSQLAQFILDVLNGETAKVIPRQEKIDKIVAKYTSNLPRRAQPHIEAPSSVVILTGSTGSLGSYLLHDLLKDETVSKVYCFNRSDAKSRQMQSFTEKGLDTSLLENENKVEFVQVAFGAKHFGIPDTKYREMLDTVTEIVHNAWKVNFNHPVESFEDPHIKGVAEFVNFSLESKYTAHLSFISSISTIGAWTPAMGPSVPEAPFKSAEAVLEQGYGESKHVAERICFEASRKAHIPTTIFRVGQVAGPTTQKGQWNRDEWLPNIVATSKALGKVPSDFGGYAIDWVPVDTLATILVELLQTRRQKIAHTPNAFYHLVNPSKATWPALLPAMQAKYSVQPVPFTQWCGELASIKNPSDQEVREKPALKLLDFYRGLATDQAMSSPIETAMTQKASETMATLEPITSDLMANWLNQWQF